MLKLYLNHSQIHNAFLVQEKDEFAAAFFKQDLDEITRKIFYHYQKVLPNGKHLSNVHINPSKEEFAELFKKGQVNLIPYCIINSAQAIKTITENSDTRLYGVDCDLDKTIETAKQMKSKIYCANLIKNLIPVFANEFTFSDKQELFQKAKEFMETTKSPIVIKPEYTQGGFGSSIIHTEEELRKYLEKNAENYFPLLEVQEDKRFIIEKYIPNTNNISTASYLNTPLENNNILSWNSHTENVTHRGCSYPSNCIKARKVHKQVAEILEKKGYLGIFEIEQLSEKFGEINSRHPHSYALIRFMNRYYPDKACYSDIVPVTIEQLTNMNFSQLFKEKGMLLYTLMEEQGCIKARFACINDTIDNAKEQIEAVKNGKNKIFSN